MVPERGPKLVDASSITEMFEENIGSKLDRYVGDSITDVTRELRRTKLSLSKRYWRSLLKARGDRDESTIVDSDVC